jgi:hypothetical protein
VFQWSEEHQTEMERWFEKLGPPQLVRPALERKFKRLKMTPAAIRADCDGLHPYWLKGK